LKFGAREDYKDDEGPVNGSFFLSEALAISFEEIFHDTDPFHIEGLSANRLPARRY
jgi:hypothetical protein